MSPASHQLTVSVRVTLWLKADEPEPVVPVTVRVEVPAGVPGFDVTVLEAPPPPLPQDASASVRSSPRANTVVPYSHRFTPKRLWRATADARAANSKASISKPLRLPAEGGSGRRSREPRVAHTSRRILSRCMRPSATRGEAFHQHNSVVSSPTYEQAYFSVGHKFIDAGVGVRRKLNFRHQYRPTAAERGSRRTR